MPELQLQRREGAPWWAWLLAVAALALVIWWIVDLATPDRRAENVVPQQQVAGERQETVATGDPLPVALIVTDPNTYLGQPVSGEATVTEVVSNRGFWLEENGQRLFVVIDEPTPETKEINPGQRIRLTGTLSDANRASGMAGIQALEADTKSILDQQRAFIVVDERDITILDRPAQ